MKELHLTMQIRNNLLRQNRVARGLSCVKLCEITGMRLHVYLDLERLRTSPRCTPPLNRCRVPDCEEPANRGRWMLCKKHREVHPGKFPLKRAPETWVPECEMLAKFYECQPADLFPASVLAVEKSTFIKEMDVSEVGHYLQSSDMEQRRLPPGEALMRDEQVGSLRTLLSSLTPIEEEVLRKRFGIGEDHEFTFDEIGTRSKERLRQIQECALSKLRLRFAKRGELPDEPDLSGHRWEHPSNADVITIPRGAILDPPLRVPQSVTIGGQGYEAGQVIRLHDLVKVSKQDREPLSMPDRRLCISIWGIASFPANFLTMRPDEYDRWWVLLLCHMYAVQMAWPIEKVIEWIGWRYDYEPTREDDGHDVGSAYGD